MKTNLKWLAVVAATAIATVSNAQVFHYDFAGNFQISGGPNSRTIVIPDTYSGYIVSDINVNINITGVTDSGLYFPTANGDFYAYLTKEGSGSLAVLLNRVGKDVARPYGYGKNDGLNVTLSDQAVNNIHTYETISPWDLPDNRSVVTGTWKPDGRLVDPTVVTTSDSPNGAPLSALNGETLSGTWILYIQDLTPDSGLGQLVSWSMDVTVVPEPATFALVSGLLLLGFGGYRKYAQMRA